MTRLFSDGLGLLVVTVVPLAALVSWGTRAGRLAPVTAWVASMAAMIWFVSLRFFPGTLWGPFPSGETMSAIFSAIGEGARQTVEEVAPVPSSVPLLLFVAVGLWITVWLVDTGLLWLRNPLLGILSAVPLFAIPGAIVQGDRLWLDASVFLAVGAAMLYLDHQRSLAKRGPSGTQARAGWPVATAARIGAVGVALAALAAPIVPGFGAEAAFDTGTGSNRVEFNPIVAIKPALDDERDVELFRVESSAATYHRLTALDVFDGEIWRPSEQREIVDYDGFPSAVYEHNEAVHQRYTISALGGPWLPAAYVPIAVGGNAPRADTETATLFGDRLRPGLSYSIEAQVPNPAIELLDRPVDYDPAVYARYLALPRLPAELTDIARDIVGDADTPYQQALALQVHLRGFRYDEDVAQGHSFSDIVTFLTEVQAGYCEQFAGSMAVLARILGIPSRVAIGFGVGEQLDTDLYRVTTRHAHAWVELFFPQAGWVRFEPTPRAGVASLPAYTPAERPSEPTPGAEQPEPAEPSARPSTGPTDRPIEPDDPFVEGSSRALLNVALVVAILAVVAAAGPVRVLVRRRRRAARAHGPRAQVAAVYADFLEWCDAAGVGRARGETPREHAIRLRGAGGDAERVGALVDSVEHALWAPPNGHDPAGVRAAAEAVRRDVSAGLSRSTKVRASMGWRGWPGDD